MMVDDDNIVNLYYHNRRLNATLHHISYLNERVEIEKYVYPLIEKMKKESPGIKISNYKARLLYDKDGVIDVTLSPYKIREVRTLKCVICDQIEYPYKSADRAKLNELFAMRSDCDDIIIIKDGMVTDTSICNVAFWDGKRWFTPQYPLLKGIRRETLLEGHVIKEENIPLSTIKRYSKICLFNAMIPLGVLEIGTDNICLP